MATRVLVLGGGPDAEREVSINSATAIADALKFSGRYDVELKIIDKLSVEQLRAMPADVLVPYLHGPYGEGGPLQDVLEADGRPFVGSGALSSRLAMDKVSTKMAAVMLGVLTAPMFIYSSADPRCPFPYPVVCKPVHEGSTVGLFVCADDAGWQRFRSAVEAERKGGVHRAYMIEPRIGGASGGRELTVGVLDNQPLPIIEIKPKDGLYDYDAKYKRSDTQYIIDPSLPGQLGEKLKADAVKLSRALQCRHISRVDFMLDQSGRASVLEINTTPGFTDHSLVPKAARHLGMTMPDLCSKLVEMALRDGPVKKTL
jgi:D-alanine-D-alanine ligase